VIRARGTIDHSRCDSCTEDNEALIVTLAIGHDPNAAQVIRLCHHCIETELLPSAAPWALLAARHHDSLRCSSCLAESATKATARRTAARKGASRRAR
jgi:hypothetical protein